MTFQPPSPAVSSRTGITEALAALQGLEELPTADHVVRLRTVHDALTAALSSIDEV
jgi:hypothetical protein